LEHDSAWKVEEQIESFLKNNLSSHLSSVFERIKQEWLPVLFKRCNYIPTNEHELLDLIRSQPDYKSAIEKEAAKKAEETSKVSEM
jgi:hypothetical protein